MVQFLELFCGKCEKYGAPPTVLFIVRTFHEGMKASVPVKISDSFEIRNSV